MPYINGSFFYEKKKKLIFFWGIIFKAISFLEEYLFGMFFLEE